MKVICIYEGIQKNPFKVIFMETYTVVKVVGGWELLHVDTDADFYILEEMPPDQAYHSKLFAQKESAENTEFIKECENIIDETRY